MASVCCVEQSFFNLWEQIHLPECPVILQILQTLLACMFIHECKWWKWPGHSLFVFNWFFFHFLFLNAVLCLLSGTLFLFLLCLLTQETALYLLIFPLQSLKSERTLLNFPPLTHFPPFLLAWTPLVLCQGLCSIKVFCILADLSFFQRNLS